MKNSFFYFSTSLEFYLATNEYNIKNTKELMQCQWGTETSTMVDNHGLLEMRGETR